MTTTMTFDLSRQDSAAGAARGSWFVRVRRYFARLERQRADRAVLYELSDHLLKDMGISRHEIKDITALRRY